MPPPSPCRPLPATLEGLAELALDLRWSWNHATDDLWLALAPELWSETRDPWAALHAASEARLHALADDARFLEALAAALADRRSYLATPHCFGRIGGASAPRGIAYFCMEFGLSETLPLYAGGLGVLAGDYLKTASDVGVPIVGIGLLYAQGYLRQFIDLAHVQQERYPINEATRLPLQRVSGADGEALCIELPLPGRALRLRVWQLRVGRTSLYLLDSDDPRNSAADRAITARLYGGNRETRLLQEIVLGVGGWSLIETLGLDVEICHINEGHAAFALLERASRHAQRHDLPFAEAWWATRAGNVFTTHTAVGVGFDTFDANLLRQYASAAEARFGLPASALVALGRRDPYNEREPFNLAYLAMRGCAQVNAVSALHGRVSRKLFGGLYRRWPEDEVPIGHVTNGVHVPSWDSAPADALWTAICGKERWRDGGDMHEEGLASCDDRALWRLAAASRGELVAFVRSRLARQLAQRGGAAERLADARRAFDPNVLTLGFARRFTAYKRPTLLLHDAERLTRLLLDQRRPMQIVVAGLAHADDPEGKAMVREWIDFADRPGLRGCVAFIENYDLAIAQRLVQGVDVWINTPRRLFEACGTSGMKTLVNGGLNLSVRDGWWDEAYAPDVGWAIDGSDGGDPAMVDAADAEALYARLEHEIAPVFYARDADGLPRDWLRRMRASMARLTPRYGGKRMLLEYLDNWYRPAARRYRERSANGAALARSLHAWQQRLMRSWSQIHFGECETHDVVDGHHFRVAVYLGELEPGELRIELYAEGGENLSRERIEMMRGAAIAGSFNGFVYSARVTGSRPASHYTARAIPAHADAVLPIELPLICWQR